MNRRCAFRRNDAAGSLRFPASPVVKISG